MSEETVLEPDETIEATDDADLVNYEGGSGPLMVCDAEGSVVLERERERSSTTNV